MRLVNIDDLIKSIEERYCRNCDNLNYARCRLCLLDDAIKEIDNASTVDAIPVLFVSNLMLNGDPDESKAAWRVLKAWKDENKNE